MAETLYMETPVILGSVAVGALLLLKLVGVAGIASRRGAFVWVVFLPSLFLAGLILWVAIQVAPSSLIVAAVIALFGAAYLVLLVRWLVRQSRSVSETQPAEDLGAALVEPLSGFAGATTALVLMFALVAVAVLIVAALMQQAR